MVMVIIGLLAAIAIPAFFSQRSKANDASAKEAVRSVQTALETYATQNSGSYSNATAGQLKALEQTIPVACSGSPPAVTPCISDLTVANNSYTVEVTATTTLNRYAITRNSGGTLGYPCVVVAVDAGGCTVSGGGPNGTWN
jgi:type IV pilus assembly protein PilA